LPQDYLKEFVRENPNREICLITPHGSTESSSDRTLPDRLIGDLEDTNNDLTYYLINSLNTDEYSVVIDGACAGRDYTPSPLMESSAPYFSARSAVNMFGGRANQINTSLNVFVNGHNKIFDWAILWKREYKRPTGEDYQDNLKKVPLDDYI